MARGVSKQNFLKDNEKKLKREEDKAESKVVRPASSDVPPRPKKAKRSKALDRRSYACGAVVAVIVLVLLLLCMPHFPDASQEGAAKAPPPATSPGKANPPPAEEVGEFSTEADPE
mmetsp:Transcript_10744/g.27740  ORF Transcript_10744/g.27740 Transcript_10744/m.27740 type:complete len:116 (-) Transcript_10744:194-541(-)